MSLTQELGGFISGLDYAALPEAAIRVTKLGFLDCSGVMIAGSGEPVTRILERTLGVGTGSGESSVLYSRRRAPAPVAALVNGTAAHALDFDDAGGHRSAILVPAILAEGETLGATGRDMILAYVAAFEVWSELVRRETDQLHEKGWHPTGMYGAVAASAAVAKLRKLDPNGCATALALGASQASGVVANFGTMTKPFHAGSAASAGVLAGRLAANGMTASLRALEHERGFLSAVSPLGRVDRERSSAHLGTDWHIVTDGVSIKKYPTCYCTHRAIDGMLDLLRGRPITPDAVRRIRVRLGRTQAAILINHRPQTGLEAKFSIEFAMACALLEGEVTLQQLTDEFVGGAKVQALLPRVEADLIDEYDPTLTSYAPFDQVTVELATGEVVQGEPVARARGHISRPLGRDELLRKFVSCLSFVGSDLEAEETYARLEALDELPAGWPSDLPRRSALASAAE